ncbi:ribonuclease H-like domain-containing protein [Tanacetum coccineum]|uniref:Ribonuclease H-like domain-containing protein n=1 Tax=Tanacetum coccineum TaxID=301880 RepID=A0ABQ4WV68_9ASTR
MVDFVAFGENPKEVKITGGLKGKISTGKLDFEDVYFVKELKFNLFSVSQMCDKKNSVLFTDTECVVLSPNFKLLDENHVFLRVPRKDNMYSVDLKNIVPSEFQSILLMLDTKPSRDEKKKDSEDPGYEDNEVPNSTVNVVGIEDNASHKNIVYGCDDHPLEQIIEDIHSAPQTRRMTKSVTEHGTIGTKWVYMNKKDERGIVIRNKVGWLLRDTLKNKELSDYDEVFALVARIEAIRLFLAYALIQRLCCVSDGFESAFLMARLKRKFKSVNLEILRLTIISWKPILLVTKVGASFRQEIPTGVFLDKQVEVMSKHKEIYVTPSHTKKIFANMKREGKGFSGRITPLFQTMMVQAPEEVGKGSAVPTDSHHTTT